MRHLTFKDIPFFPELQFYNMAGDKTPTKEQFMELLTHAKGHYVLACHLNSELFQSELEVAKLRAENEFMLRLINERDSKTEVSNDGHSKDTV
jgi:hypothetical protein